MWFGVPAHLLLGILISGRKKSGEGLRIMGYLFFIRPKVCSGNLLENSMKLLTVWTENCDDSKSLNIALIYGSGNTDGVNNK